MLQRLLARLAVALVALVLLPQPVLADDGGGDVDARRQAVQRLREQVDRAGEELARAASAYEERSARLDQLRQLEYATSVDAEGSRRRVSDAQAALNALAAAAYRSPVRPDAAAWMRGDLRAIGDLTLLRREVNGVAGDQTETIRRLTSARSAAEQLAEQQRAARQEAQRLQAQLDGELAQISALAVARQEELTRAQTDLLAAEAAQAARLAAEQARLAAEQARRNAVRAPAVLSGGGPSGVAATDGAACAGPVPDVVNGFLPPAALCALSAPGQRLAFVAAPAFEAMSRAYASAFGVPLCVSDSYRDYAGQVDVFRRKPSLAATPGRSQHGWGLALDLCGGVEQFGTPQNQWMLANAGSFGYVHPAWAEPGGSRPEPWHWEYAG